MKELQLKYGCNPNQKPSKIYMADGSELPIQVLSGRPGYINFLDAFNGWQLVRDLKKATGLPAATSFKHVSPAGASIGLPLNETLAKIYWVDDMDWKNFSPLACAYARARGADRMSSFGDFISLSDVCDKDTAMLIKREVSDGVIAPGYTEEALEILKQKKKGNYNVIQIDENYVPEPLEHKQVFGVTFEQGRQELAIDDALISNIVTENKELTEEAKRDMKVSLIILKYTQSNSVCFVKDGQAIGVGDSSPVYIVHALQARKQITGTSVSARRYWSFRLKTRSHVRREIMPLMFTLVRNIWMSLQMVHGKRHSQRSRKCSQKKRREHGWMVLPA